MKYGKLFKGYRQAFGIDEDFSANKVSELSYKELREMAKNLRTKCDRHIPARYVTMRKTMLQHAVYQTLRFLYR